jgi:hypothetical protein
MAIQGPHELHARTLGAALSEMTPVYLTERPDE